MRWRAVVVLTNTPRAAHRAAPGGLQGIAILEPILAKAARILGIDQVAIRSLQLRPKGNRLSAARSRACNAIRPARS